MQVSDKKKHILETAENLFATKGYDASTVRDIADAAGVNLAMISYYFGSKEKMMESLFHERMRAAKLQVEQLLNNKALTPFEKVEIFLDEYLNRVLSKQCFHRIMLVEQVMQKNTVIINLMKELKLGYAALFMQLVKEGQKKKVFKKNVDIVLALATMTGTVTQLLINKNYYAEFNKKMNLQENELNKLLYNNLTAHLKNIFKTILGYEQ